jgi:hypothetical protein
VLNACEQFDICVSDSLEDVKGSVEDLVLKQVSLLRRVQYQFFIAIIWHDSVTASLEQDSEEGSEDMFESLSNDFTNALQIGISDFSASMNEFESDILAPVLLSINQLATTSIDKESIEAVLEAAIMNHSQTIAAVGHRTNELIQAHQEDRKYSAAVIVREKLRMRWSQLHISIDRMGEDKLALLRQTNTETLQVS